MKYFGQRFFAPDGGGDPPTPPQGGDPPGGAPPAVPPGGDPPKSPGTPPPTAYRPDGLPDHLFGASDRETIEKLFGAYKPAREQLGALGEVPKDAAGYQIEWADPVKPYADVLKDDKFLGDVKGIALKHRIPTKQFSGFLNDVMSAMVAGDMVAEPFSADRETAIMLPDVADPKERSAKADALVRSNIALVEAWKQQDMPAPVATFLLAQMDRGAANLLVDWIRDRAGEQRPALRGDRGDGGAITEAQLDARMSDPRGKVGNVKYDPAFVAETDRMYRQFYGD